MNSLKETSQMTFFNKRNNILILGVVITVCLILGLSIGIPLTQNSRKNLSNRERATQLLDNNLLIDGHNDIPHMIRKNFKNRFQKFDFNDMKKDLEKGAISHTDLARIKEGKLSAQFWVSYANCDSNAKDAARLHLEQVDTIKRLVESYPNEMVFVTSSSELKAAFRQKKIASMIGLESGHAIDSSLAMLRIFYYLGTRYMTLTHNCDVPWATNNLVDKYENASSLGGLTKFGRTVIQEMNRLGMMVDLSHVSYATMIDALNETKAPVIFSHSSVFSICNHTRNVRDDVLLKLKENKGIVMINFANGFVNCNSTNSKTDVENVAEHFTYVKNLIGVDYLGIGADYDGVEFTPEGLEDVSKYPNLVVSLLEKGWTDSEIIKIMGANLVRVFEDVEKYAKLKQEMRPIDDLINVADLTDKFKECRTDLNF